MKRYEFKGSSGQVDVKGEIHSRTDHEVQWQSRCIPLPFL